MARLACIDGDLKWIARRDALLAPSCRPERGRLAPPAYRFTMMNRDVVENFWFAVAKQLAMPHHLRDF